MSDRRKGPRRDIVRIARTGTYGAVRYHHLLECDHVEVRTRASRSPQLACGTCVAGEPVPPKPDELMPVGSLETAFASVEHAAALVRASIAARLHIDNEAVDVRLRSENGEMVLAGATVYLSAEEALRLL